MSDQEIKEQIDDAARTRIIDGDLSGLSPFYAAVQLSVSQDKIATNRTVEAAIAVIEPMLRNGAYTRSDIISELEKLRR